MKTFTKISATLMLMVAFVMPMKAQYYQLVNQATNMLQTALSGGANYRGYVEASYMNGLGDKKVNFVEISTTQGVKYGSLFFMGVGLGVDFMHSSFNDGAYVPTGKDMTQNAAMIPMFTDFRFTFGQPQNTNFFIGVKVGAGFYISDKYIQVGDGYINTSSSFYLKPSIGVRIPVSKANPKYAVNLAASYQLLTNSYWYNPGQSNSVSLNSIGFTAGFEW